MGYFIDYDDRLNCVVASVEGKMTPALMGKMSRRVRELFDRHDCRTIFNDLRNANMAGSDHALRAMAEALDNNCPRDTKRALVVVQKTPRHESFETACFNRGHLVRFFTDPGTARSWIGR